nr:hypothetical protein [Cressdnaviricota sp.]
MYGKGALRCRLFRRAERSRRTGALRSTTTRRRMRIESKVLVLRFSTLSMAVKLGIQEPRTCKDISVLVLENDLRKLKRPLALLRIVRLRETLPQASNIARRMVTSTKVVRCPEDLVTAAILTLLKKTSNRGTMICRRFGNCIPMYMQSTRGSV